MKIAFLDCFSGISGDMFVGALLDAGLDLEALRDAVLTLPLEGVRLEARKEKRNSIQGTRFIVRVDEGSQPHRSLEDIRRIISESGLDDRVKEKSLSVFNILAEAEGAVHGEPPDHVHFHEVGAADSIVDIVGGIFGMLSLGIERVCTSPLPLGSGFVATRHGPIPVPAPATVSLLQGVPVRDSGLRQELVTPTGAALIKALSSSFGPMPSFTLEGVGYGVGFRELPDRPNLLRILLGSEAHRGRDDMVVLLEANLDDCQPEFSGYLMERLLEAGALDVSMIPAQMKKNRPGTLLQVLGRPEQMEVLEEVILAESTTLGVRRQVIARRTLERSSLEVESPWGPMTVKTAVGIDGIPRVLPEYEVCRRIALERKIPLREVYAWIQTLNHKTSDRGIPS